MAVALTDALIERYGIWVCGWRSSATGDGWWDWPSPPVRTERTLTRTAELLVEWRSGLEDRAERFNRFLPRPDPVTAPDEAHAAWERAIAHLITAAAGGDGDTWQGPCLLSVQWLLDAAGAPEQAREVLTMLDRWLPHWGFPTSADIVDFAEAAAQHVTGERTLPTVDGVAAEELPDTWPHGWPSWRSTNLPTADRRRGRGRGR